MRLTHSVCRNQVRLPGDFFSKLSSAALKDFWSLTTPTLFPAGRIIFAEGEQSRGIHIVMEGEVKLSINSSDGRRLSLRIAREGDMLGLPSALSGSPCETTAKTVNSVKLLPIRKREFLGFLVRHPEAYLGLTHELTRDFSMACEQLRTVALLSTAPAKLARLLLDWSEKGRPVESGMEFRSSLTHEEIGEFIGASRETVTRTLTVFKNQQLVEFQGSTITIHSRAALANYAGC